jgi:hypothetical protein
LVNRHNASAGKALTDAQSNQTRGNPPDAAIAPMCHMMDALRSLTRKINLPAVITSAMVGLFVAAGCAEKHTVQVDPDMRQPAPSMPKLSGDVAVVFADGTKTSRYKARPISLNGTFHSYDFEIGEPLCRALMRSVNAAYHRAVEVPRLPRAGQYAHVIVFSLKKTQIDVSFEDNAFKPSARALSTLAVQLELLNGTKMTSVHQGTASGKSFLIRALNQVTSLEAERVFASAIQASIRQLSDNAIEMLTQWSTEKSSRL